MQLVLLRWHDASFEMDTEPTLCVVETVGWLVRHDDAVAVVASEAIDGKAYRAYTCVPAVNVIEVVTLSI